MLILVQLCITKALPDTPNSGVVMFEMFDLDVQITFSLLFILPSHPQWAVNIFVSEDNVRSDKLENMLLEFPSKSESFLILQ